MSRSLSLLAAGAAFGLMSPSAASAAEVVWDGHYRARGEFFNNLSLSVENPDAEGAVWQMDHRLRLRPGFLLSDKVSIYTQVDLLPYVKWGQTPVLLTDPLTGESQAVVASDAVAPPTTVDGAVTLQNIQVTRLWGEVKTPYGLLRFGRVPNEWGSGMVFNAGNRDLDEFGDTVDRVQFAGRISKIFLMGGFENRYEGVNFDKDDYRGVVASVLYQGERAGLGTFQTWRWQNTGETRYTTWIGDIWGKADLGIATIETELVATVGGGDLTEGVNDLRISAFGGHLSANLDPGTIRAGLMLGFATGDADPNDSRVKTFSYDPDFNVSLFLFEEPMPTLRAAVANDENGGRSTEAARTGYGISNALFLRPSVGWRFNEGLTADVAWFAARQAKPSEVEASPTGPGYGSEVDATVTWEPIPHFRLQGTGGVFLPGKYFTEYDAGDLGTGFDRPAVGGRLLTTLEF